MLLVCSPNLAKIACACAIKMHCKTDVHQLLP